MEPTVNNPTSGGTVPRIMVFRPTWDEFKDFNKYILYMESCGAHKAGLAKVVPPPEWKPRKDGYDMEQIGKILIPAPISQVVTGKQGVYQQLNIQKAKMTVKEFQKVAESDRYRTPRHFDYEDLERKYWKNITYVSPIYGADVAGSLTDEDVKEWNINKLGSILDFINEDYGIRIDGVNTAYLYFGMWKTSFAWHTEDMDLYSINYLHFGAPKSWYSVPPEHGRRLERMANGFFPSNYKECPAYLRHKMFVISPQILKMYSIPYNRITQEPGEFMVTFPYGYHAGFNHGFNCAESTNFASPRWVEYGKRAVQCHCRNDMVKISMDTFVKRFQPERYELWIQGQDVGPHPEDMSRQSAAAPPTIDDILCNKNNTIIPDGFFNQKKHKRHPIHKKAKDVVEADEPCQTPQPDDSPTKHKVDTGTKRKPSKQPKLEVVVPKEEPHFDEVSASSALLNLHAGPPVLEAQNYAISRLAEAPSKPPVLVPIKKELENCRRQPDDVAPVLSPITDEQREKKAFSCNGAGNENDTRADVPSCSHRPSSSEQAPHWSHAMSLVLQNGSCTFEQEAEYNYFCSQVEPYCSVCSLLFSPRHRHTSFASPEWKMCSSVQMTSSPVHLKENVFAWHLRSAASEELPVAEDQTGQKMSTLLRCSCCYVCVHASCYGVPETSSPFQWLCRRCQAGDRSASCCLCSLKGGALKPTNDNRWAHVTCAVAIPEVYFDDTLQREPVNVRFVLKERGRLTCAYCRQPHGVCVQCSAERCTQAFHVSCGQVAGVKVRPAEFPTALSMTCTRHRSPDLSVGHFVWARYPNHRYYRARINSVDDVVFYWVDFSDGSTSKDTYPEDILNYKCKEHGPPPVGAAVHVLWTDGKAYDGTFRGTVTKKMYTVEFDDRTQLTLEKEYVYDLDNGLPKKVQLRLGPVSVLQPK